ncbi:UNVERIFIED_CONTAM: hypothetical protein GTU68_053186 [Idotea baltica]|nr:hypothetical protein [Idotea baltica]
MEWPHLIDNALKAHHLYKKDVNYVVERDEIVIIDENTGRKMAGRQWSDGLHQAVESKEGVKVKEESQTLATITLQNYFKLYGKLAGMTGTAMTEANEFWEIYKLEVMAVPTNRTMQRINFPDNIYGSDKEKWDAVVEEVKEVYQTGRPVLVGTTSIETSELVSTKLRKKGVKHDVLNAKQHEREAEIVAQAGRKGAVTIATNMAGRGTDIILGGNPEHAAWEELKEKYATRLDVPKSEWDELTDKIADAGGLHVIGTERHDSRRIDLQLRGRAGRQGDPGSSRFFISLEDKLMRLFAGDFVKRVMQWAGLENGEPIVSSMVTRRVEGSQKKVEERHFDQRKNLLEYDEVMDEQRKRTYAYRQKILDGQDCRELLLEMMDSQIDHWVSHMIESKLLEIMPDSDNENALVQDDQAAALETWAKSELKWTVDKNRVVKLKPASARSNFIQGIDATYRPELRQTEKSILLEIADTAWKDHLHQMDILRQGINFVGYAQKDPKTEYKREGRRMFNAMWSRIHEQVTSAIFRIEQITATEQDVAPPIEDPTDDMQTNDGGGEKPSVKTIINDESKVGRNDPCPCGSGKKYKKCHGRG